MSADDIKSPIPLRNKAVAQLISQATPGKRPSSSTDELKSKRALLTSPQQNAADQLRARSITPTLLAEKLFNGLSSEDILKRRLKHYNINYPDDEATYLRSIYDKSSQWFSRDVKPKFEAEKYLPYKTESHKDKARYLCHVLVNLHIAISSLDIQGLLSITSKDLADLQNEIDDLALNTDLFRLANEIDTNVVDFKEHEDHLDLEVPDSGSTGKITAKSSSIVSVNHWTNELNNCLNFDFPLTLRKSLASVYYYLSLIQGQKIVRSMYVDMFESLVAYDDDGTNFTHLVLEQGLVLDFKIIFDFICQFLPYPDSDYARYDLSSKDDLQLFRLLLKLAHVAKPFFDANDESILKDTMDYLLSNLSPSTTVTLLPILNSFVPYHYHKKNKVTDYLPFCFSLWSSVTAIIAVDTHLYDFVGEVAEDLHKKLMDNVENDNMVKFGKYGLFSEDQMAFMFNRVQGHLRTDGQIHSYSRTVKPFVYSINGSDNTDFFTKFVNLIQSIETFVHPSNNGFWTKPIAKFVHAFIKLYHGRVKDEETAVKKGRSIEIFLSAECHFKFVDILFNILMIGAQNKSNEVANYYISCYAYLLEICPKNSFRIFDRVLVEIYDTLTGEYINSRHRVISSLKQFTRILRFMVVHPLYRIHITNILSLLIDKIDMNDPQLTSNVTNSIVSIATFVPFQNLVREGEYLTFESTTIPFIQEHIMHLKMGQSSDNFETEDSVLDSAFRASTTIFENVIKVYVEKIFSVVDIETDDPLITKLNQTTVLMQEAMDDKVFDYYIDIFQRRFWDNDYFKVKDPNYELTTIPLSAIVRRKNSTSVSLVNTLIYNIKQQVERGAGSIRSSSEIQQRDVKLVLYLTTLNDVLRQSHESLLSYSAKILDFMKFLYEEVSNPPIDVLTSILTHSVLATLNTTEIIDYRLFGNNSTIPDTERWGGLQFDKRKYDKENLDFIWHTPSDQEVKLSIDLLENLTDHCITSLERQMNEPRTDTSYTDKIQKYSLVLTHCLSGISLLIDPDFNKNKTSPPSDISYKDRLTLLKNIRESNCDNQEFDIDIEQIRSTTDEETVHLEDDKKDSAFEHDYNVADLKHSVTDNFIIDDTAPSGLPTGVGTPVAGVNDISSSMNSGIIFRDLDIYTSNYYFGNTVEEKLKNPDYLKVHQIRAIIGSFFFKLHNFVSKHFQHNTTMFQIVLHGLKVWFTDIGQETIFNEDPDAFIDIEFLDNLQSLAHVRDSFTRTYLAVKTNDLHQSRVLLHSTNRYPSKLEIKLLEVMIEMATSIYPDIHKPAQSILAHCMKQLIGSYSIIIREILAALRRAIEDTDHQKISAILRVFMIKKIDKKLMSDYKNIGEAVLLLIDCCKYDELDIAFYAENLLNDIVNSLRIPSSVCIYDEKLLKFLEIPDASMDLQVKAVRLAKSKKREQYFSIILRLQDDLLEIINKSGDSLAWKVQIFITRFICKIQASLEFPVDKRVIDVVYNQTKSKHPQMVHLAVRSYLSIFNKIFSLSDYDYDIRKAYENGFDPYFIKEINTTNSNFPDEFLKEMNNFDAPKYFIDSRASVGWLCWGKRMKVVESGAIEINLQEHELEILGEMGKLVSKDWIDDMCSSLVHDNETRSVFSSGDVSLIVLILVLVLKGFTSVTLEDIFTLCKKYYDRYDKASMIMSIEIFAALICSSKYMNIDFLKQRDAFVDDFLNDCLNNELNHDCYEIWNTLSWWLPTVVDIRRCKPFYMHLTKTTNLLDVTADNATHQSFRLLMMRSLLMSLEFRSPDVSKIIESLVFDHPYDQVRSSIGKLLNTLTQNSSSLSLPSTDKIVNVGSQEYDGLGYPVKHISDVFDQIIKEKFQEAIDYIPKLKEMTPQEIIKTKFYYTVSTLFYWMKEMTKGPNKVLLTPYIIDYLLPFLMTLSTQRDMCKLAGLDPSKLLLGLAYLPMRKSEVSKVVQLVCHTKVDTSHQLKLQLLFVQHILSTELLQLTKQEKTEIFEYVVKSLFNGQFVEVRVHAADVLSGIIHNSGEDETLFQSLLDRFSKSLSNYTWEQKKKLSKTDIKIHGSVLGLGAIISAFPYVFPLPKWIPSQLSILSSWARTNGMAGLAAKNTINTFKKVRSDTWKFDRESFSAEELEDLEGVLWKSYYA
ncbi:proteasome activator BLM10 NDAI_0G03330 [Naumovozyma dairenensis CBS 421]|uniref:Uncharacterized protein n=1 Tax=Naumovozyma dairenensis (strain ATCC 10597 / BCRC 20456 / CBS 421 / NBRC 0211 / NRRL Y-12639) TaxID=1071378 RepID=G0WE99_NAUDC|nr:hypothetical protein NDAI_0G03330 [Naumovozyma dairenensis CBS 421]CCD26110.2 hypothetical protein NDAI_0G03330 [Naumovozyma dairenensis CBS 421]